MATNDARSAATVADLMSFTWTFLPTATIDLIRDGASDMPRDLGPKIAVLTHEEDARAVSAARTGVF
jgi:hypothetical protein